MSLIVWFVRIVFLTLFIFLLSIDKTFIWLGIFIFSLILGLFFGRLYCGYLCPMNTLMEPTSWLSKKLKFQSTIIPKCFESKNISLLVLILSVITMIFFKKFLGIDIPILLVLLISSVVLTLKYKPELFHNKICPFGIFQSIVGKFSKLSNKVLIDKCVGCKLCEKTCPSNAIKVNSTKKAIIDTSLCFQCTNCKEVCPKSAIVYKKVKLDTN